MSKKKIPKSFKLFGTTVKIEWDNKTMNDKAAYGECVHSTSKIIMSDKDGVEDLSYDVMIETFYHEKTHAVLNAMTEYDLSKNEKFVDLFSKLWRQADETSEY